jgi:hypothetical protein
MRPYPGKRDCMVFDHALNVQRHGKVEEFDPPELSEVDRYSDRKRKASKMDFKSCPACDAVCDSADRVCGECGHEFGRKTRVDFMAAELVESGQDIPQIDGDEIKRVYLMALYTGHIQ